jgi:hypothetical protein
MFFLGAFFFYEAEQGCQVHEFSAGPWASFSAHTFFALATKVQ